MLTTALGTSFNVKAVKGESVAVILITGKVQVNETESNTSVILNTNEKVCYKMNWGFSDIKKIENLNETLWKDGILVFENRPMPEVLHTLEKWYNVKFQFQGDIDQLTFSGTYDNEYLSNVLKSMAYSIGFEYEINGRNVELKFKTNMNQH